MIVKLFVFVFLTVFAKTEAKPKFAKCEFEEGVIFFREAKNATEIYGEIYGLTDGLHGIHVHQEGGLGNGCKDAGGHFDPDQVCKISISIFAHFSFCIRPKMKPDFTLAILEALNRWMVWQWLRWKTLD